MVRLDVQSVLPATRTEALTLRSPVNWTAVGFFAALAALHLFMAGTAMLNGRWDGYLSLIFGVGFAAVAVACGLVRTELAVLSPQRRLRLRTGSRRIYYERSIRFGEIRLVRLTLLSAHRPETSTIELVCDREVIDCPPTKIPREQALCLAVTIGARLIKVFGDDYGSAGERIHRLTSDRLTN